jgi:hypothetical protein
VKTKEEAVREELQHGRDEGMLADLVRTLPRFTAARLRFIADGASMEPDEVDLLFDALLDEDSLEDEPDPEAPAEREGVRSWVIQGVVGVEGPSLSLSPTAKSSGTRIAGPKPWGGGRAVRSWSVDPQDIFEALGYTQGEAKALATAVEGFRKINEVKYPALYPTS